MLHVEVAELGFKDGSLLREVPLTICVLQSLQTNIA